MSDDADQAQAVEELERQAAIRRITAPSPPPPKRLAEGICEVCAESIEDERLAALPTARVCVECQAGRERLAKLFGRR